MTIWLSYLYLICLYNECNRHEPLTDAQGFLLQWWSKLKKSYFKKTEFYFNVKISKMSQKYTKQSFICLYISYKNIIFTYRNALRVNGCMQQYKNTTHMKVFLV